MIPICAFWTSYPKDIGLIWSCPLFNCSNNLYCFWEGFPVDFGRLLGDLYSFKHKSISEVRCCCQMRRSEVLSLLQIWNTWNSQYNVDMFDFLNGKTGDTEEIHICPILIGCSAESSFVLTNRLQMMTKPLPLHQIFKLIFCYYNLLTCVFFILY